MSWRTVVITGNAKLDYDEYNYSDAIIDGTVNNENIMSDEERKNYFLDKPISKMTEQDEEIWELILNFIQ